MFYYKLNNKIVLSREHLDFMEKISEGEAAEALEPVYLLTRANPKASRRSFSVSDPALAFIENEGLGLLQKQNSANQNLPQWLVSKMQQGKVISLNMEYPRWREVLAYKTPKKWKIHVVGLGDVGGTLITGLRLLGGDSISSIGIFDIDANKVKRWEYECNQILPAVSDASYPDVVALSEEEIFDCDLFAFCVTVGIPSLEEKVSDVRMVQFEGNSKIVNLYAKKAREKGFKGIFAVVSDPVDLLCKSAFIAGNTDDQGQYDFMGLGAEQIRGYGLGVMHARAAYYAKQREDTAHYVKEGRAFGPHGEHLIIADSIENYNNELSLMLTDKARNANLEVRAAGYKPYIAPAFSSGTLALLATIRGEWHYSATFMGGVFMGSKNRWTESGIELESLDLPEALWQRLQNTYTVLENIL